MSGANSLTPEVIANNILYFLVNDSRTISPLFYLHIGGQTPAPFYLAPNLAVRYGFIRLGGVPSYLIRVWPGRQGHHVVHTGLLQMSSQKLERRLPAHLMSNKCLLAGYLYQLWQSIISLILHQGKCQTQQPVECCSHNLPSIEGVGMGRSLTPLLGPGTKIRIQS